MAKFRASGTIFQRGDGGAPETFSEITQAMDLEGPGTETDFEDTTTHTDAAASNFKAYSPLMRDGGEVKTDVLWDPSLVSHIGLDADQAASRLGNYRMVFPTSPVKTANFAGYVKDFSWKAPVKGMLTRSLVIKITGNVTIT